MVTATFLTEDSYLGSLTEPLTLNRYNYCVSSYLNYTDPSGNKAIVEKIVGFLEAIRDLFKTEEYIPIPTVEGTPIVTPARSPKFTEVLKEKDYFDEEIRRKIASQFMTYSLQNDERLGGLVKRSAAEAIVFLENNYLTEYDDLYSDPDVIEIYRNFLIKYEVDNLDEYLECLE